MLGLESVQKEKKTDGKGFPWFGCRLGLAKQEKGKEGKLKDDVAAFC